MAELVLAVHEYRHLFAVAALEFRVCIDINDSDLETLEALQPAQSPEHFLAEMADLAAVYRERRSSLSCH